MCAQALPRPRAGQAALDFPGALRIARARRSSSLPGRFASARFGPFERLAPCCPGATWAWPADEIGLAPTQRLRHGERSVAHGDLATVLGNVEWLCVRRVVADKRVALAVDEQIAGLRREIAVATPEAGGVVAPALQETLLRRPGCTGHQLQAPRVGDLPGAREIDDPDELARDQVVYRCAGAHPFAVVVAVVLEGEHLYRVIHGQRCTDAVRAVDRFAAPRALDKIHLGSPLLQPIRAAQVQGEPRRVGHLDQAVGLLSPPLELLDEHVPERSERMLEPALLRLGPVRLDGGHQVGRIEARDKPAPPRLDDRRPHACRRLRWKLGTEPALAE